MDRSDLLARIEASSLNARLNADHRRGLASADFHWRLLELAGGHGRLAARRPISTADVQRLLAVIRENVLRHMLQAHEAMSNLLESECRFECEEENFAGERHQLNLSMRDIPYMEPARDVLRLAVSLAGLPLVQQEFIVECTRLDAELRSLEVREQLERDEGTTTNAVLGALSVAAAQTAAVRAERQLQPHARAWLAEHAPTLSAMGWSHLEMPVLGCRSSEPERLLRAAASLGDLSDCLVQPFSLDELASSSARQKWRGLWSLCQDAAEAFAVAETWLSSLGSIGTYRRCDLCFRHLGEGMKKNCSLHRRTAQVRIPGRELQMSKIYKTVWRKKVSTRTEVQALLEGGSPAPQLLDRHRKAAEDDGLETDVAHAAACLGARLHTMLPLFGARLQALIKRHFAASVQEANKQRRDTSSVSVPPARVLRILTWERFFGALYGSLMPPEIATAFGCGKPLDLDHPLCSTNQAVSIQKLALDLVHLDAWVSVDMAFDSHMYLNGKAIALEIADAAAAGKERPTYRVLASRHRTTPQTIEQALKRGVERERRRRVLKRSGRGLFEPFEDDPLV